MYYGSRIAALVLALAAALAIVRARADAEFRRGTPEAVERAVDLAPSNAEYLLFRALQLDYDGADATPLLERAANLNPMSSTPRIRLGLAAEIRSDNASAEKWFLDAARIDHQFEPRWTLANFYFRRENLPEFWTWLRAALEVSYGDRRPAFDLAWRTGSPAGEIARAIPDRGDVVAA
jgi:tetratricopeptide (TPR) repeat protein